MYSTEYSCMYIANVRSLDNHNVYLFLSTYLGISVYVCVLLDKYVYYTFVRECVGKSAYMCSCVCI